MKKRALSIIMAMILLIGMLPIQANAATLSNGIEYEVYEDHVEITGYSGKDTEIVIPAEIEGLPVTSIGDDAFAYCYFLLEIVIPDSVTSIGDYAFDYCFNLTSIVISEGVTSIGNCAFDGCSSLTSIELPKGVTSIGDYAFHDCDSLTDIVIPDSVTSIGNSAFNSCSSLIRISVDEKNPNYSSDDRGVLFDKTKTLLICAPGAIADTYTIPDSVASIDDYAFCGCSSLTDIVIHEGITSIGNSTFSDCTSLTSIELPKGITSIGTSAFRDCSSLTEIVIPDSVTSIGLEAFCYCFNLTSIVIPENVTSIGNGAFFQCSSLTDIRFKGDAPEMYEIFYNTTATAYYPAGNPTWTKGVMLFCGGNITWVPYNPNNPFSDVPVGSWYEEPVVWAVENGITSGTSENSFSPDNQCLRSHVAAFLWRAAGSPEPISTSDPFTDVTPSDYFYKPVLWAVENGITSGVSANYFGANDVCNRYQVVFFLWRAAGSPEPTTTQNPFTDVKSTDFFYKAVLWAVENGITSGISATQFGPNNPCTRAQVVTFLYRAYS